MTHRDQFRYDMKVVKPDMIIGGPGEDPGDHGPERKKPAEVIAYMRYVCWDMLLVVASICGTVGVAFMLYVFVELLLDIKGLEWKEMNK